MKSKLDKNKKEIKRMAASGKHYEDIARSFVVNRDTMLRFLKAHGIKFKNRLDRRGKIKNKWNIS